MARNVPVMDNEGEPIPDDRQHVEHYLADAQPCLFPTMEDGFGNDRKVQSAEVPVTAFAARLLAFCEDNRVTLFNVLQTAWALVLRRYVGTEFVCFGYSTAISHLSQKGADRDGFETGDLLVARIHIDSTKPISKLLDDLCADFVRGQSCHSSSVGKLDESFGLPGLSEFNTAVLLVPHSKQGPLATTDERQQTSNSEVSSKLDLVVRIQDLNGLATSLCYKSSRISEVQATNIAHTFAKALFCIMTDPDQMVEAADPLSDRDRIQIHEWNSRRLLEIDACIHDVFAEQAQKHPDSQAICSWDGELSYKELDDLSTRLAQHLVGLGVRPGVLVPFCFEKSLWTIVSVLAVLKAGGACVPLEPSNPTDRLKSIIQEVQASMVLTSPSLASRFKGCVSEVTVVGPDLANRLPATTSCVVCEFVRPHSTAFVVFTSGSTGTPKGVIHDHTSVSTGLSGLGMSVLKTRFLHWAAYSFILSIMEIFLTVLRGGCLCIPSEEDRKSNISHAMCQMRVDSVIFTPSFLSSIRPEDVPHLEMLGVGGESVLGQYVEPWTTKVRVVQLYGSTESLVFFASERTKVLKGNTVARAPNGIAWVVDVNNHNRLVPVGAIGELLVEGVGTALGYLNDEEKTERAFIKDPPWLQPHASGRVRRLYKTGDLVRQNADGSISFVERRDFRIKLHGQRIEPGEVEYHLRRHLPAEVDVIAEVILPAGGNQTAKLAAFLSPKDAKNGGVEGIAPARIPSLVTELEKKLSKSVPAYMIPSVYIPLLSVPRTISGKIDRRRLQQLGAEKSIEELATLMSVKRPKTAPVTEMEREIQSLWAKVLNIDATTIGVDDNFFRLGGDSISAIRLVAAARATGISLLMTDILSHPTLSLMSSMATRSGSKEQQHTVQPFFSLICRFLEKTVAAVSTPDVKEIQDVLEATDFQSLAVSCSLLESRGYSDYAIVKCTGPLDTASLVNACRLLVKHHPILRTVFVAYECQLFQIILKSSQVDYKEYYEAKDIEAFCAAFIEVDMKNRVDLGSKMIRFTLVRNSANHHHLIIRLSHALYDGLSMSALFLDLKDAYSGKKLMERPKYSDYVHAVREAASSRAEDFWRSYLAGASMTNILAHTKPSYKNTFNGTVIQTIPLPGQGFGGMRLATIVKAAWSLVLAALSGQSDIVFGIQVSGRNLPLDRIEDIVGLCLNLVPVRVKVESYCKVVDLLHHLEEQQVASTPWETMGFRHIIERCTDWPRWTRFSSILHHQNVDNLVDAFSMGDVGCKLGWRETPKDIADLFITSTPLKAGLEICISFCTHVISRSVAERILQRLCSSFQFLSSDINAPLESVLARHWDVPCIPWPLASRDEDIQRRMSGPPASEPSANVRSLVQRAWSSLLRNTVAGQKSVDVPYYDVCGDLVAAVQLATFYCQEGIAVTTEDIIEHPTMRSQEFLCNTRRADATGA